MRKLELGSSSHSHDEYLPLGLTDNKGVLACKHVEICLLQRTCCVRDVPQGHLAYPHEDQGWGHNISRGHVWKAGPHEVGAEPSSKQSA